MRYVKVAVGGYDMSQIVTKFSEACKDLFGEGPVQVRSWPHVRKSSIDNSLILSARMCKIGENK